MSDIDIREEAKRLIDALSPKATWDDLMQVFYVRQCIDAGLSDSKNGKLRLVEDVRKRFGLSR